MEARIGKLEAWIQNKSNDAASRTAQYAVYRDDPLGFFRDVLKIEVVWERQGEIACKLLEPPYRVLVPSGNECGKTLISAAIVLWWFCTRSPAIVVTTAPKFDQVKDLLWKEVRTLARRAKLNLPFMPRACRIERAADDFAVGVTANDSTSFQGHHGPNILFVVEEATGVEGQFFEAIETMFSPPGHAILAIFNPTDVSAHVYREYKQATSPRGMKSWNVVRMRADEHPNIIAELKGESPPIPHAVRLASFERRLIKWSQLVAGEPKATDIQWPPAWAKEYCERTKQPPQWYRPGPIAEARLLGRFPSSSTYSVWGDGDWQAACRVGLDPLPLPLNTLPEIGVDVARGGADFTAFHVRCGPCSIDHSEFNGQDLNATMDRCRKLAKKAAAFANKLRPSPVDEFRIPIKVDDDGLGGGVVDVLRADGYAVVGIKAATKAVATEDYPARRDELWFTVAEMARCGELDLSRLSVETLDTMQTQALAPLYRLDSKGRRVVEPKDETKKKIGRSPDSLDAMNLAYAAGETFTVEEDTPSCGAIKGAGHGPGSQQLSDIIMQRVKFGRRVMNPLSDQFGDLR